MTKIVLTLITATLFLILFSLNVHALPHTVFVDEFTVNATYQSEWNDGACHNTFHYIYNHTRLEWLNGKIWSSTGSEKWSYKNFTSYLQLNDSTWEVRFPLEYGGTPEWASLQITNGSHGFLMRLGYDAGKSTVVSQFVNASSNGFSTVISNLTTTARTEDIYYFGQWINSTIYFMNSSRNIIQTGQSTVQINEIQCISAASRYYAKHDYVNITTNSTISFQGDIEIFDVQPPDKYNTFDPTINFNFSVNPTSNFTCDLIINDTVNLSQDFNGQCYQETPTVATYCGGLDNGSIWYTGTPINPNNYWDGNQATYASFSGSASFHSNYSKPFNAASAKWTVHDVSGSATIAVPSNCFDAYPDTLWFLGSVGTGRAIWYCNNGAGWTQLRNVVGNWLYEEYIIWNLTLTDNVFLGGGNVTDDILLANNSDIAAFQMLINITDVPLNLGGVTAQFCHWWHDFGDPLSSNTSIISRVDNRTWTETDDYTAFNIHSLGTVTYKNWSNTTNYAGGTLGCIDITEQFLIDYGTNNFTSFRIELFDIPLTQGSIEWVDGEEYNTIGNYDNVFIGADSSENFEELNQTPYIFVSWEYSPKNISFSQTFPEGLYNWSINCSTINATDSTITRTFLVDYTNPMIHNITINNKESTTGADSTKVLYADKNYFYNFTFTDDNLYSVKFQWSNGTYFKNYTNIAGTVQYINFTLNTTSVGNTPGVYYFNYSVSDGHTANKIKDYNITKNPLTKGIKFDDDISIIPLGLEDILSDFEAIKQQDRYQFIYTKGGLEKLTKKEKFTFLVKSKNYIDIIQDSKYAAHLVILDSNKWIDFEIDELGAKYKIKRNKGNEVEVEITGLKEDKLIFNSIGELNTITDTYYFIIANATVTYRENVVSAGLQNIVLDLDIFNRTLINSTNATLYYNVTWQGNPSNISHNGTSLQSSITKTEIGTVDRYNASFYTWNITNVSQIYPFYWYITITDLALTENNINTNATNQTVFGLNLYDCDAYNGTKVITFNGITEEHDQILINYTMNIWTTITFGPLDVELSKGFNFSGNTSYSLCIPINMTGVNDYTLDAIAEYKSLNNSLLLDFVDRKYHIVNMPLNNTERIVNLYLLDDTRSTDIVLNVLDKISGIGVPDAYIKILRFYPETGEYLTVEIEKTDNVGQTLGKMVLADVFYKFIIEKDQEVLLSTTVEKILSTNKKFYVSQTEDSLETFRYINDVAVNLVKDYPNKRFILTWSDTNNLVANVILEVRRSNTLGTQLISSQKSSSAAGTLTYTITEATDGNNYKADVYILSDNAYSMEHVLTDNMFYGTTLSKMFGVSVLFPVLLLLISIGAVFMEFGGAVGVIGGSLVVLVVGFFTGLIPISWVSLTSLIIIGAILIGKMRQ